MFYRTVRGLFRLVARPMLRFSVEGVHHVPESGPALVIARHRSWLDPPAVGGACPRPVRFLIVDRVYHTPWTRWFYRGMRGIPVTKGGAASSAALRAALRALGQGEMVGIFPEGRVVHPGEESSIHSGAAMLALRTGAPVVPVELEGTGQAWPPGKRFPRRGVVRVRFLPAIEPASGPRREAMEKMTRQMKKAIGVGGDDGEAR